MFIRTLMDKIAIRPLTPDDLDALQAISRQTFYETFVDTNTGENLQKYLDESFATDKLQRELADQHSLFWFALQGQRVIGYLKVNVGPSQTVFQGEHALEIERIYVLAEFHGKEVGQMLLEKSLQIARQRKATLVWLGVWEHNHRAIRFYRKNGFVAFDTHIFPVGDDPQTDLLMKRGVGVDSTDSGEFYG